MMRNQPSGTTFAVICAVIVVLAIAVISTKGAVPAPSADAILAMQQQATADSASSPPPAAEPCLPDQAPHGAHVIQIKRAWVESWAVGDDQDSPDRSSDEADLGPDKFDNAPLHRGQDHAEAWRDQPERPRVLIFSNDRRVEDVDPPSDGPDALPSPPGRRGEDRRPEQRQRGPWEEVNLLLKSFNDLIDFYDEQGRWEDKERTLKERIGICRKLAELHLLAQTDGPGAAMQEFYRSVGRRDRAIEMDLHNIEQQIERLEQKSAELDAEIARLDSRRELLERKRSDLNERREQRTIELSLLQEQTEDEQADCDDEADDDDGESIRLLSADLARCIEAVKNAMADHRMDSARRTRLERRQTRILETPEREAVDPATAHRETERPSVTTEARRGRRSNPPATLMLNTLDPSMGPQRDLAGRAWRWLQGGLAEIDACIRRANSRLDQTLVSRIAGPPENRDQ